MHSTSLLRAPPTHHLITLLRSPHGLPARTALTLRTLGLHRLHQAVLHPFSAPLAGKLLAVKELVSVRNVDEAEGRRAVLAGREGRREGAGWEVVGRAWGGGVASDNRA